MGFKDWFRGRKAEKALQRGVSYAVVGGTMTAPADNKTAYITEGYTANDIIYSIVNLIVEKVRVAPWGAYKVEDESSLKLYRSLISKKDLTGEDYKRAIQLRHKALKPVKDDRLDALLEYPNDYCGWQDLVGNSCVFKLITGGRMIWADQLDMGANKGKPMGLHILPYNLMTIKASRDFPIKEVGYSIEDWQVKDLPIEQVLHDKFFNPNYDAQGSHLFGLAPMKAALLLTSKSNEANKTEAAQFVNQGPKKVIFMDDDRFTPEQGNTQVQAIKKILQGKEYAGGDNAGKVATSGYKVGVIDAGLSPVDLGIIESEKWTLRRFCNVFGGVPSQLLNDPENKSYNNQKEGEKALTTRGAMPLLVSLRDSLNRKLYDHWGYKDKNIFLDFDLTVYSELQDDLETKWKWVRELPVSWGYKMDLMGLDYDDTPEMKEIAIPSGFVPIDSLNVVDEELNGEDADSGVERGNR